MPIIWSLINAILGANTWVNYKNNLIKKLPWYKYLVGHFMYCLKLKIWAYYQWRSQAYARTQVRNIENPVHGLCDFFSIAVFSEREVLKVIATS